MFVKGVSGNPGGRRKGLHQVSELARTYTEEAILKLVTVMRDGDGHTAMAAANALLDRGWGRPAQSIEHSGPDGGPLEHLVSGLKAVYGDVLAPPEA